MEKKSNLDRLRAIISRIDTLLLSLLNARKNPNFKPEELASTETCILQTRNEAVILIGLEKRGLNLPTYCPDREEEEIQRLSELAERGKMALSPEEIREYFSLIFEQSRLLQEQQATA